MGRVKHRKKFWEQHIAQWDQSDLSQGEYCRLSKISLTSFKYWRSKTKACGSTPALVELALPASFSVPTISAHPQLCIVINDQYRIEIGRGFDAEDLERVLRVMVRI